MYESHLYDTLLGLQGDTVQAAANQWPWQKSWDMGSPILIERKIEIILDKCKSW